MKISLKFLMSIIKEPEAYIHRLTEIEERSYNELSWHRNCLEKVGEQPAIREDGTLYFETTRSAHLRHEIREVTEAKIKAEKLLLAYESLQPMTKQVINDLYINNKSWLCTQEDLGISRTTVSRHRQKAIKIFREIYNDLES